MRRVHVRGVSAFLGAEDAERFRRVLLARRAWGHWLNAFLWDHFVTLTFQVPSSSEAAVRDFEVFKRRLEQRAQQKVYFFRVLERGAAELLHVHALLAGTQTLSTGALANAWHRGRSDVSVYDPGRGASYYVSKTLTSSEADYDFTLPDPTPTTPALPASHAPRRIRGVLDPSTAHGGREVVEGLRRLVPAMEGGG